MTSITFIGAGNMARAMIGGLLKAGYPASSLRAGDPDANARAVLGEQGITTSANNPELVSGADAVVLAVKPQVLTPVLKALGPELGTDALVISIAAGLPIAAIEACLPAEQAVVRCMPNTPALLGLGITAMYPNEHLRTPHRALAELVIGATGRAVWVPGEAALDAVTAVSGSGPAYFFYLMEAMIAAGVEQGLEPELARELTVATAVGAAAMADKPGADPAILRQNVTSPGGTTERALSLFEARQINHHIRAALAGAAARSRELAAEFGNTDS